MTSATEYRPMQTLMQVRTQLIHDASEEFLARLCDRVDTGVKTQTEANLYRSRLPRAVTLATTPGMMQQTSPGVWDVWSTGKDMDRVYTVGKTCSCPDADPEKGKAPLGWCKHRLACFLALAADKGVKMLEARLQGLRLPHMHTYECGHTDLENCWDCGCLTMQEASVCDSCTTTPEEGDMTDVTPDLDTRDSDQVPLDPPTQYEVPSSYTPPPAPMPEAAASLNVKVKKGPYEFMYTMRAHTDAEILARLPAALAGLERALGIDFTDKQ